MKVSAFRAPIRFPCAHKAVAEASVPLSGIPVSLHRHVSSVVRAPVSAVCLMASGQRETIDVLVVDDDRSVAKTIEMILVRHGYRTMSVNTATEALALARRLRIELLITDRCMPDMDGISLSRLIRTEFPKCTVIVMSGSYVDVPEEYPLVTGDVMTRFITKPISPGTLVAFLKGHGVYPSNTATV